MIVVDTSAVVAILLREPEADGFVDTLLRSTRTVIAAPSAFELRLVMMRKQGPSAMADVDAALGKLAIDVIPWTAEHVPVAQDALLRFGGHPARLNFGDCLVYALAKSLDAPLLFKGDDFRHTDVRAAL